MSLVLFKHGSSCIFEQANDVSLLFVILFPFWASVIFYLTADSNVSMARHRQVEDLCRIGCLPLDSSEHCELESVYILGKTVSHSQVHAHG